MKLTLKVIFCFTFLFMCTYSTGAQETKTASNKESLKKNGNISSKYNKSKNLTTVSLKPMALTELRQNTPQTGYVQKLQMDMETFFTYPGETIAKPVETVTLRFHGTANNYIFAQGQPISVVLDEKVEGATGRMLRLGDTDYKSDLKFNSIYEEYLTISIPADALTKISEAKTIAIYVGSYAYSLKEKQVADLRDMASRLKP